MTIPGWRGEVLETEAVSWTSIPRWWDTWWGQKSAARALTYFSSSGRMRPISRRFWPRSTWGLGWKALKVILQTHQHFPIQPIDGCGSRLDWFNQLLLSVQNSFIQPDWSLFFGDHFSRGCTWVDGLKRLHLLAMFAWCHWCNLMDTDITDLGDNSIWRDFFIRTFSFTSTSQPEVLTMVFTSCVHQEELVSLQSLDISKVSFRFSGFIFTSRSRIPPIVLWCLGFIISLFLIRL